MYRQTTKRFLDLVIAVVLLLLLSPLFALTAIAIRLEDGGQSIFRQRRVGRDGAVFTIYKFRSMPMGTPSVPSASGTTLKVTRVGWFIRRTNIDELPQLWNVLRGDMSLIGPRPALLSQTSLLESRHQRGITRLRPGLTGLAQVNAYDGMPEDEKLRWEERYANSVSLTRDITILLRTLGYLLRRPPAY
ncbi:MAG: sugar transferase [Steroidobacteraceae bacterium]